MMQQRPTQIPENAVALARGELFTLWQWQQEMPDGSMRPFEMVEGRPAAMVIAILDGKILVQVEQQTGMPTPKLSLPGGFAEPGESPLEAAKRELLEETGCVSDDWQLIEVLQNSSSKIVWPVHLFVARRCVRVQAPKPGLGEKILETRRLDFGQFMNLIFDPVLRSEPLRSMLQRIALMEGGHQGLRKTIFG